MTLEAGKHYVAVFGASVCGPMHEMIAGLEES
jgi:hypothetical protein